MKSINVLQKNGVKRLLVLSVLMLGLLQNLMAQSVTQLPTESNDSDNGWFRQAQPPEVELTIEEVMEIAEEEIERTAQEAVKAAILEVGGELAFEKERADQLEAAKINLEIENKKLKEEVQRKNNQFFYGALIGGSGAVIITSLVYGLIASVR